MLTKDIFKYAELETVMMDAEYNASRYPTVQNMYQSLNAYTTFEKQRLKLLSQVGDLNFLSQSIGSMIKALEEAQMANAASAFSFFSEEYLDFDFRRHKRAESVRKARQSLRAKKSKRKSRSS